MRFKHLQIVVILGAISIIGIIVIQSYFLFQAWNKREKQVNQAIQIALKGVADDICRLNEVALPVTNPVQQLSFNYFVVDINSTIDANILEHYLKREFDRMNINLEYEYAIYDCQTDRMVYGNYIRSDGVETKQVQPGTLPKYQGYLYYFGIQFPTLKKTIASDLALPYFFTVILLVSILFFAYSIYVILQQRRLSDLQRDFINTMTHEIKTPVSTIKIAADVITNPTILTDPQRLVKYGELIRQENQRLNALVDKVLQVAHLEKGKIQLKQELIDLNELIKTIHQGFITRSSISDQLSINLWHENIVVKGDLLHLTNIFNNLLDNSIKYGGKDVRMLIQTQVIKGKARITFEDDGPGIDPRFRKKVFKKFFRIMQEQGLKTQGFGLGLFYVKSVCDMHHWNIELDTQNSKGVRFIIDLPKQQL